MSDDDLKNKNIEETEQKMEQSQSNSEEFMQQTKNIEKESINNEITPTETNITIAPEQNNNIKKSTVVLKKKEPNQYKSEAVKKPVPVQTSNKPQSDTVIKIASTIPITTMPITNKPVIFTSSTYESTWKSLIEQNRDKNIKKKKGMIIIVGGGTGDGKTWLECNMVKCPEIDLGYGRIIPKGSPLYFICFDSSVEDEVDRHYKEYKWKVDENGKLIGIGVINCYVKNPNTNKVDHVLSLQKAMSYINSLVNEEEGTMVIDWTKFCQYVLYAYMILSGGPKSSGISFNQFERPVTPLSPTEYQYKAKVIEDLLLSFQNDFKINVLLETNVKEDIKKVGSTIYDIERTGEWIEDMQKGSDRMADVVVRMWRETIGTEVIRKLTFKKSRFEDEVVDTNKIVITKPTAEKMMQTIVQLYLQKGKIKK